MKTLFLLLVATASVRNAEAKATCEPITIPLCKGIGYNMTSYPNSYGHEKQEEAGLEVHQFYPLVEVGCYQHLKFFLCAMYTPICQENYDKTVLPCMEVCLEAKKRCSPLMQRYGFRWPTTLSCDQLPRIRDQATTGQICAAPPDTPDAGHVSKAPSLDNAPLPPFIEKVEDDCECRCVRPFQQVSSQKSFVGNVSGCAYPCHLPSHTPASQHSISLWLAIWSGTCFFLSLFTCVTYLIETDRFQYPERPIFILAFCQMMVSIGFLVRVFAGHDQVACDAWRMRGPDEGSTLCLLVFLLTYFFGMAASVWWVVLALTWVLAAASKWSSEAIASYSLYFHITAWVLPAVQTAAVVWSNAIDGDPISGICYVGATNADFQRTFVLIPLVVYFTAGVFFLCIGFFNLWRIRDAVRKQHPTGDSTNKLTQLMSKIGIFSVLYTVPAMVVIVVLFYEQHYRPRWEQAIMCSCAPAVNDDESQSILLALVKTASMLVVGWTSGVWIFSGKTLTSWKNFICCLGGRNSGHRYQPAELIYEKGDIPSTPHLYNTALRRQQQLYYPEKL